MKPFRALLALLCMTSTPADESVRLTILADEASIPIPCRIHLKDAAGKPIQPPSFPFWSDHFVCTGQVTLKLPAGKYSYEIERGPEYSSISNQFTIQKDHPLNITNHIRRLVDLSRDGWWSGELHIHRALADIELLMRAEDLHVAPVITWWNKTNPWKDRSPTNLLVRFDRNRFYEIMGGEDERAGGALLYFNLAKPLKITDAAYEFPSPMKFLLEARAQPNVWVDIEKPFWYDAPIWIASGQVNSIGIANNHMYRSGVYSGEAWGRARDTTRLAGVRGNGFWSQEIYYHILNTGVRLPPSAGSASGVLPNPVGYNRAYVHIDGELTYEKWFENLRAGRVFVSNGPLLRCHANGELPGHVFKLRKGEKLDINFEAKLDSRDPIAVVEIIKDGKLVASACGCDWNSGDPLERITFEESGWFLVRALADVPNTFRFASTGPFYVEREDAPKRVSKTSAQFFLDWVHERMARVKTEDPSELEDVLRHHRAAEKFWQAKVTSANAE
jgi:hypothetical protein